MFSGLDIIIPTVIATLLKQSGWDRTRNTLVVFLVYIGWTVVSLYMGLRGTALTSIEDIAVAFPPAFSAALATGYAAYTTLWKNLFNEEALTHATSIDKGVTEQEVVLAETPDAQG